MPFLTAVGEAEAEAHGGHVSTCIIADTMPLWSKVHDQTFGPEILIVTATSTEEAIFILHEKTIFILQKKQINLVMTDMNFPNLNGLEFVMIIEKETRLPIVMMCDPFDQQLVMDGLTSEAAMLGLTKPRQGSQRGVSISISPGVGTLNNSGPVPSAPKQQFRPMLVPVALATKMEHFVYALLNANYAHPGSMMAVPGVPGGDNEISAADMLECLLVEKPVIPAPRIVIGPRDRREHLILRHLKVAFLFKQDANVAHRYAVGSKTAFSNVRFMLKAVAKPESQLPNQGRPSPQSRPATQLRSILKKPFGREELGGPTNGGSGPRTARVRFNIGEEKSKPALSSNEGAQMSELPLERPLFPVPQFVTPPINKWRNNFHENYASVSQVLPPPPPPSPHGVDIYRDMVGLLTICYQMVNGVKMILGYMPYHEL